MWHSIISYEINNEATKMGLLTFEWFG